MRNSWILYTSFLLGLAQAENNKRGEVPVHYRMWSDLTEEPLPESTARQDIFDDILLNSNWILERHSGIVTDDDYVLELWRMRQAVGTANRKVKDDKEIKLQNVNSSPVLLSHGMYSDGIVWFGNGANSIAYLLAESEQAYDVWILNNRVTDVSNPSHFTLTRDDADYWDISFDDVGKFDVPAALDYIADQTSQEKVTYIGHSAGTTALFTTMCESRKEYYISRLNSFVALAPPVRMNDIHYLLQWAAEYVYEIQWWLDFFGITHIDEQGQFKNVLGEEVSVEPEYDSYWDQIWGISNDPLKEHVLKWETDWLWDITSLNDVADVDSYTYPSWSAIALKMLLHYTQITKEEQVLEYNYLDENVHLSIYGQTTPPLFPIEQIDTVPIYLNSPSRDTLSSRSDIQWLYDTLAPNYAEDDTTELVLALTEGGHATPLQAIDMSEFTDNTMPFIARHIQ